MIGVRLTEPCPARLFTQHRPQASPDQFVQFEEDTRVGVLEVSEPASERPVEIGNDEREALPAGPPRLLADRLLQLVQTLLAYVSAIALEPVAEELKSVPLLPAVGDPRLLRVQCEAVRRHPCLDQRERRFGFRVAPGKDDEVVR